MTVETVSTFVTGALTKCELKGRKLCKDGASFMDEIKVLANLIPGVGGALAQEIQNHQDYRESEFFRKLIWFINELNDTSIEERMAFCDEISKKAKDYSGNIISSMIDRLDNINKETVLANLVKSRINGHIGIDDFFRLSSMLERIPYVDLQLLSSYTKDFYDESGDTELLFATGALQQSVIDSNGEDKYVLSKLGRKLLLHGLKYGNEIKEQGNEKFINASNTDWRPIAEVYDADDGDDKILSFN